MLLNKFQWFRERGWHEIDATRYEQIWQTYGGSVATHPTIIDKLSKFANIPVRYLGWQQEGQLVGAIACWGDSLALSRDQLKSKVNVVCLTLVMLKLFCHLQKIAKLLCAIRHAIFPHLISRK